MVPDPISDAPPAASVRLGVLVITVGIAALGLALIAALCGWLVPPLPQDTAYYQQFTVLLGYFYTGQPAKSEAYEIGCLATPFLLGGGFFVARIWVKTLSASALRLFLRVALALHLSLFAACFSPLLYCPHPPYPMMPPSWLLLPYTFSKPFLTVGRVVSLVVFMILGGFFLNTAPRPQHLRRITALLLVLWVLLAPTRFMAPGEIHDGELRYTYHLNAVTDALSQSINGHHLLVDFPHIYGGYIEFLAPLMRLFPRSLDTLLLGLAIPSVLTGLFALLIAILTVRQPQMLLLCGLAVLSFHYLLSRGDPNYGYSTARTVFSSFSLFLAVLYFRRPGVWIYLASSVVGALATIWNLDTGLVLWGSWLGTLLVSGLASRRWKIALGHLVIQTASLVIAWAFFWIYLRLVSGHWPDPAFLFYFQKIVVESGYFCIALGVPDVWMTLVLLYLIGFAVALAGYWKGKASWKTDVILLLSLSGVGFFSYFMGRSAESNLAAVCYPGILLLGILASESRSLVRLGKLPPLTRRFLSPFAVPLLWWTVLLVGALPDLLGRGPQLIRNWQAPQKTPMEVNVSFVQQQTRPHEDHIYFLSNYSGLYYYLTDTLCPLRIPGTIELLRTSDMNVLLDAIRTRRITKLFVEQNFYDTGMYRPDIYQKVADAVAQNYRFVVVSPSGMVTLYVPR